MRQLAFAALSATLLASSAWAESAQPAAVTISTPWARATPGGATTGAAYVTITAPAAAGDTLLSVETTAADHAELHEHIHEGDVMKMRRVDKLEIKPGTSVTMEPMGYHLMLVGLKAPLKAGDTIHLSLSFQSSGKVAVDAPVIAIGAAAPKGPAVLSPDAAPGHDHMH